MLILLKSIELPTCILHLSVFIGLKMMYLVRPSGSGFSWDVFTFGPGRGQKSKAWHCCCPMSLPVCFHPEKLEFSYAGGKGITVLLHGENTMDSAVWSFLYM